MILSVSVPVRGVSCNPTDIVQSVAVLVSVPVRGVSCNQIYLSVLNTTAVSVPVRGVSCNRGMILRYPPLQKSRFSPHEGCELQPDFKKDEDKKDKKVSVPVRGVSCNRTMYKAWILDYVSVPVRGVSCNERQKGV